MYEQKFELMNNNLSRAISTGVGVGVGIEAYRYFANGDFNIVRFVVATVVATLVIYLFYNLRNRAKK